QQIKYRLQQLDIQIEASKRHHMGQSELFLIISRLDEFAAAVNGQLATTDFTLQCEIIRALVKRIEIYKEEIVIVFRVDPDPGCNVGQKATDSVGGGSIMQDRKWRTVTAALEHHAQ
ncbi:hypothetical protein, partial [Vreelandella rituensis]|uniref:hypothetical protein n=1 Tax=Vreelandella rituensis TaxID=2282306 RepID=UPI0039EDE9E2